jgi:hypothetical protein
MRKTLGVCLLVLLLTGSVSAGIMGNDTPAPPPPQPTNAVQEPTENGDIQNGVADAITDAALTVLNNVLALL